ncbi:MAG: hypothetical protein WDZ51_03865 [Pirellulaceae bacterium]
MAPIGRRKGSRNKGYFYRRGRGWFAKDNGGRFIALTNEAGERLKAKDTPETVVKEAHARFLLSTPERTSEMTFQELSEHYLAHAKRTNGADATQNIRAAMLFDFSTGYGRKWLGSKDDPTPADRIHPGYGQMAAEQIQPFHVHAWLDKHPGWNAGTARLAIQAVKRVLNFGKDSGLIERNRIKGMAVPAAGARITCLNDEQEQALLNQARGPLTDAITVLLKTGMRPLEFTRLTAAHVHDLGDRMELRFKAEEVKTRKARIVRIADPEIIELIRGKPDHKRELFRNGVGDPWIVKSLSRTFLRAKNRAEAKGIEFDPDCCLYSCRHTFAKRVLTGYWSGRPVTIEVLAQLMGNSPQVCRSNYLQWCDSYVQPLWDAVSVATNANGKSRD